MIHFIAGCIAIIALVYVFSGICVILGCNSIAISDLIDYFRAQDVNKPTTTNYWKNRNMYNEYAEEILRLIDVKEDKKREIIYLQSSLRKSTLRNRTKHTKYATEEDIKKAKKELTKLEKTIAELYKCRNHYYWKTKEITREMHRRRMWGLARN